MIVGIAQRPKSGEQVCGDSTAVVEQSWGMLVMLCDGTGQGPNDGMPKDAAEEPTIEPRTGGGIGQIPRKCVHGSRGKDVG